MYTPPSGWVEPKHIEEFAGDNPPLMFHRRQNCENIRQPNLLRATDKPYSAARCKRCDAVD